jgi:hypothetical protein
MAMDQTTTADAEPAAARKRKTLSVPEAGRIYFDLGEWGSYEAARRGEIPTIRIGRRLRVPVVALERMLEQCGKADQRVA